MFKIKNIHAREVLDSRGNPTIEVSLTTDAGIVSSIVPSGASTGIHEALELRDKEKRYNGKGVLKAVANVNDIIKPSLIGFDVREQAEIDTKMINLDGTPNKSKLGANAILGVSMAVCRAAALGKKRQLYNYISDITKIKKFILPVPQMNIMNSGAHAGIKNDIQEHMIMPIGASSFSEALQMCSETYHTLKELLKNKYGARAALVGDEGGFAPPIEDVEERLEIITQAIEKAGYKKEIAIALDAASSQFYNKGTYTIINRKYSSGELIDFYSKLLKKYNLVSIEDGMAEDDWDGWAALNKKLGSKLQIVGDDLLVTNVERIKMAIKRKAVNSLLLKVNQVGTLTEAIKAANIAFSQKWTVVVSHRSGETEDTFIADLVVALSSGQSKFGAPARGERTAKYNQLLRIEEHLGEKAKYAGRNFR